MNQLLENDEASTDLYIFHSDDHFAFITNKVDTTFHKHNYIQLTIGLERKFTCVIEKRVLNTKGIIIDSNRSHKLVGDEEWQLYMLINPESKLGECVKSKWLHREDYQLLSTATIDSMMQFIPRKFSSEQYEVFLGNIKRLLGINQIQQSIMDERIQDVLFYIGNHALEELTLEKLSETVFLSESRLSHLFKEHIGISLTSYILHKKVEKGFYHIFNGYSITESALEAGFSTPSHFTNSVRDKLGMGPRKISKHSRYLQV